MSGNATYVSHDRKVHDLEPEEVNDSEDTRTQSSSNATWARHWRTFFQDNDCRLQIREALRGRKRKFMQKEMNLSRTRRWQIASGNLTKEVFVSPDSIFFSVQLTSRLVIGVEFRDWRSSLRDQRTKSLEYRLVANKLSQRVAAIESGSRT